MNDPLLIDMSDYVPAGEGANGQSFNHRSDPSVMLKLYFPGKVSQPLHEMQMARKAYDIGIPTPEPGEYVVTPDGRYGIRFRRIEGKVSYARAVGDDPSGVARYAEEFAEMCLSLHSVILDRSEFNDVKDNYFQLLEENPFFSFMEKDLLARFISDVPDMDNALHGDLQFGNAIFAGEKRYFIDMGDFCCGCPLFDLGMVYLTGNLNLESFTREAFHMDNATARRFWEAFAPAYFGSDRPLSSIEEEVRPFAGLKTIIIERDTRKPMPEFRAALESILK